jgi:hypothetical protein
MATLTHTPDVRTAREITQVPQYLLGSDLHEEWVNSREPSTERQLLILCSSAKAGDNPSHYMIQWRDEGEAYHNVYNEDGYFIGEYDHMDSLEISNAAHLIYK